MIGEHALRGRARRQNATCGRPGSDWRTPGSARHSVRDARRRAEARTGGRGAAVAVHPISELGSGLPGADFGVLTCPLTKETEKLEATDSFRERNRWFESTSLQQTVRLSPGFASVRGQSPGFQPLCGPFRAAVVGRDAQSPAASGRAALVSLSGHIPVPQCCGCGSRGLRRRPQMRSG